MQAWLSAMIVTQWLMGSRGVFGMFSFFHTFLFFIINAQDKSTCFLTFNISIFHRNATNSGNGMVSICVLDNNQHNWTHSIVKKEKLNEVLNLINSICDNIQFTMEAETNGVLNYLDLQIIRNSSNGIEF